MPRTDPDPTTSLSKKVPRNMSSGHNPNMNAAAGNASLNVFLTFHSPLWATRPNRGHALAR
jgi:hypothetical protein